MLIHQHFGDSLSAATVCRADGLSRQRQERMSPVCCIAAGTAGATVRLCANFRVPPVRWA
jgi:hypothetical protein